MASRPPLVAKQAAAAGAAAAGASSGFKPPTLGAGVVRPRLGLSKTAITSPPAAGGAGMGGSGMNLASGGAQPRVVSGLRRPGGFKPPSFVKKPE
jgi:hypothetical protein